MGALIIIGAILGAVLAYQGTFFVTGKQWYEACWAKQNGAKATDPYQDATWSTCEPTASAALFGSGLIFAGYPENDKDVDGASLQKVCPSSWTDAYWGGNYVLGVKVLQQQGGPNYLDAVMPARQTLERAFKGRWPRCSAERQRQGYPLLIEITPGKYDWERPCARCKPQ